ncbi:MAG: hypothetical protein ACRYGK_19350 [Janthinobacterium lividum]
MEKLNINTSEVKLNIQFEIEQRPAKVNGARSKSVKQFMQTTIERIAASANNQHLANRIPVPQ